MKPSSCIALRPVCFLVVLMLVVLSLAGLLIPLWIKRVTRIENQVESVSHSATNRELASVIRITSTMFSPMNASAINLGRLLSSSVDADHLHFSVLESKVASILFQALSTIPYLSQISYIGIDGLLFAYYKDGENQTYALYSNSTFSPTDNDTAKYTWYVQPANRNTGKLYGEAHKFTPFDLTNSSWFRGAINSSNGYASVGTGWGLTEDVMFLSTVGVLGKGAVSLGFSMKFITNFLIDEIALYNVSLYLATSDGIVLTQGIIIPNTRMILAGDQVLLQSSRPGDEQVNITCQLENGSFGNSVLSVWGKKYIFSCTLVEIAGLKMVYVLTLPQNKFPSLVRKNFRLAFVLLIVMIVAMLFGICSFLYLTAEAAKREMYLCGALINQMEATQQAERKSMNKSLAFASASHDIRASLAGITGLLGVCRNKVSKKDPLRSEMLTNLQQMEDCTKDLLGLLNSILDTSKIEAGKIQLEEEEFDIEQLLEDVVDLFHPAGAKNGVDVIFDPYDGSVMKSSRVKGDRGKLKQILSNLLSNAVKFTKEGHVIVRAWTKKPSLENGLNRNNSVNNLFCWLFKIERAYRESEVFSTSIQRDIEFVFEVIDTGKGIPKEKQKSIFENYVQVKETAFGHEGTGLGLGIVQSLVRLMGGEIGIVDNGERGTCFRFNAFFSMCETDQTNNAGALDIEANVDHVSNDSFQHSGHIIRIQSPKTKPSQVLLFIQSIERSNIIRKFMQKLGIKVHVVTHHEHLSPALKRIKQKLNLSYHSSSGNSRSTSSDILPSRKKANALAGCSGFVLAVIDTRAGPFREISRAVAEFRRDSSEYCYSRVVWLDAGNANFQGLDEDKLPPSDLVISKPFHGSRLYRVLSLLPELGGEKGEGRNMDSLEMSTSHASSKSVVNEKSSACQKCEIEEVGGLNSKKPLLGKKILIADDHSIMRKIATSVVSQLGAYISLCENGEEAWKLVRERLDDRASKDSVPFDCILMDCEMPVMDGIEATRRIRESEKKYGVRIPIVALTAHSRGEEIERMIEAGVDGYLTKPLNEETFCKVLSELRIKM